MLAGKFDPDAFFRRPDAVAVLAHESEIFGLLRRSLDLPTQWAALVTRTTSDHVVVRPGKTVENDGVTEVLFARITPIDIYLTEDGIISEDRFQCMAELRLRVSLIPERAELQSFRNSILGSHRVAASRTLCEYFQPEVRKALADFASGQQAATLVDASAAERLAAALTDALAGPCFSAGLRLEGAPRVSFTSSALVEVRTTEEKAAQSRREHDAARQLEQARERAQDKHLEHVNTLLARLSEMAKASPDADLPDLIRTFSEQQRGELYEALFAAQAPAKKTRWIVVAAGDELMFFDPTDLESPHRRLRIEGAAGAVRSIQMVDAGDGKSAMLIGGATGVYRLPIDHVEPDATWLVDDVGPVRGGFNSATIVGDRLFATHSEIGLCEWDVRDGGRMRRRFEAETAGARAVRGVVAFDGHVYFAVDDRVLRWSAADEASHPDAIYTGSAATITAVCPTPAGPFAGNSDGHVLHWSNGRTDAPQRLHAGGDRPAESIRIVGSGGLTRVFFVDTSLYVYARVLGDSFTCRYEAGGQTLRRVEVAEDVIVATNDLRDRIICWHPNEPARPFANVGVAQMTGRSVQDVCLLPAV